MTDCHADCLERPLSQGFRTLGKLIAKNPWYFVITPLILSAGLGVGLCFLEQRQINKLEELFTPEGGIAKSQRDFIRMNFPMNDSGQFSAQRLYTPGTFASLIIVSVSDNILIPSVFKELQNLDMAVKNLTSKSGVNFNQLCAQVNGSTCMSANPVLNLMQDNPKDVLLTYPQLQNGVFVGLYIGGVMVGSENVILKAKALRFLYYLREDNDTVHHNSIEWLHHFMKSISHLIEKLQLRNIKANKDTSIKLKEDPKPIIDPEEDNFAPTEKGTVDKALTSLDQATYKILRSNGQVYHSTSISLQTEFEGSTETVIPLFSITYVVTILFSIVSCASLDNVRNKIWVTTFGVISPGLAIIASFGLLLLCKVPFASTVANAPFLILGIGVDNMFIIISCWKQTKVTSSLEERMADTYQEAAVSITITTLTDVLAFYIGIMTHFPSVQSFCIYTGTALIFCYIYCITFFGAILALNGIHENNNRHWLSCMKVSDQRDNKRSWMYNSCCVGGAVDSSEDTETEHPMTVFFYKYYGPFLTKPWGKVLVLIAYLLYLSFSIYGCIQTKDGIDIRDLAKANSSLTHFYDIEALYFSEYGPTIMVVVTSEADYWEVKTQEAIETCMQNLEKSCYIAKEYSTSWMRAYEELSKRENLNISTKENFLKNLDNMFKIFSNFRQDIKVVGGEIRASRFFIQAVNVINIDNAKAMLTHLRDITNNCSFNIIVYHPLFIYLDQYIVIIQNTIQNIIVATVVMLVISALFIPDPLCSLWVTFDIASIIAGVMGFMAFWNVNLDSISMINLVICIGFSVDFSAHIVYACVSNRKKHVNERMIDALRLLGYPIVQGVLSTILGISALCGAESYIFRTFFKLMVLVLAFGALHGLLFIPVFLITVGACRMQCSNDVHPEEHGDKDANDMPPAVIYRVHPLTFESQIRKAEFNLPGYNCAVPAIQDCDNLGKECYCMSWQGGIYSVLHSQDRQIDKENAPKKILQFRNKMLQVYLEHKMN